MSVRHRSRREEFTDGVNGRPLPNTEAARLRDEIHARLADGNPHQAEYEEALAPFHAADKELQRFKLEHVFDRLEELGSASAVDTIREAFALLRKGCEGYGADVEEVRDIVLDTPKLNGQHLAHDPRPAEWLKLATQALESEIAPPGLTPEGDWKVRNDG